MKEQKDRIGYIDGLRGLACIFVLLHHFILAFYPAAMSGNEAVKHMEGQTELWFSQSPLAFFVTGDLWVSVFCLVSGYVIAAKTFRMRDEREHAAFLIKRYPRLALPVFAVSVFVQIMLWTGAFWNLPASELTGSSWLSDFYVSRGGIGDLFFDSFVNTWFVGMTTRYSNAFWMLNQLFLGSFVAYLMAMAGRFQVAKFREGEKDATTPFGSDEDGPSGEEGPDQKENRTGMEKKGKKRQGYDRILMVYIIATVLFFLANLRLGVFALGTVFAYLEAKRGKDRGEKEKADADASATKTKKDLYIGLACLILAVLLGAYPSGREPSNLYRYPEMLTTRLNPIYFYHMCAAGLLFEGIRRERIAGRFLSLPCFRFLGKISYAVYLIHIPVLYSLSCLVMIKTHTVLGYHLSSALALLTCLGCTLVLAWLFWRFFETNLDKALNRMTFVITGAKARGMAPRA